MNRPVSLVGRVSHLRVMERPWLRRTIFIVLIAIGLLLTVFPERYRAATTLTPTNPENLGLSGTLGQLGALNNVFGNQAAVEVALRVGNSTHARDMVIKSVKLDERLGIEDRTTLQRWLEDRVSVRSLRGGIVQIEMKGRDADLARDIVAAYSSAMQERLAQISRTQTAYKRNVLGRLVEDASRELAIAQSNYDRFRVRNRTPDPGSAVGVISTRIPQLEAAIKAKQIEITSARQQFTDDNLVIRQMFAELGALRNQLAQLRATDPSSSSSVGEAVATSSQLFKLERELSISRALYDSYLRYLQGTAVEDMTSTANVRLLEPAYIDPERQYFYPALAAAIALFLLWMAIEFYGLRPPLEDRRIVREVRG